MGIVGYFSSLYIFTILIVNLSNCATLNSYQDITGGPCMSLFEQIRTLVDSLH